MNKLTLFICESWVYTESPFRADFLYPKTYEFRLTCLNGLPIVVKVYADGPYTLDWVRFQARCEVNDCHRWPHHSKYSYKRRRYAVNRPIKKVIALQENSQLDRILDHPSIVLSQWVI